MRLPRLHARIPSPRRAVGAVLATALAVTLASGCTPTLPIDPLVESDGRSCAPSGAQQAPADLPVSLVPGLTFDTQSDEVSFVHVATPVVPAAAGLNDRLHRVAADALTAYRAALPGAGGDGELNIGWSLSGVSPDAVGIQLTTRRTVGATTTTAVTGYWYDQQDRRLLSTSDLFTPTGWGELTRGLQTDLCAGTGPHSGPISAALADAPGTQLAAAFTADGGVVLTVSPGTDDAEPFPVVLGAGRIAPWLSVDGRTAQESATRPQIRPAPTAASPEPEDPASTRPKTSPKVSPKSSSKSSPRPSPKPKARPVDCGTVRCVALTFDDGPGPYTADLVAKLRRAKAPATFFMLGEHVDAYPGLARQVAGAGFEIGNHSYTHPDLSRLSTGEAHDQLARTSRAIEHATGRSPTLMRPPYGARDAGVDKAARTTGLTEVLWDVDTLDWKYRNVAAVQRRARHDTRRGSIVLLHDIHPTTVQAVPGLIADLRKRGYTLVTVSDLLGHTPAGARYFRAD